MKVIIAVIVGIFIGAVLMMYSTPDVTMVGAYLPNATFLDLKQSLEYYDDHGGDWIAMDIKDIEDIQMAVDTCSHEVAHHIYYNNVPLEEQTVEDDEAFAEYCEGNITKCLKYWRLE